MVAGKGRAARDAVMLPLNFTLGTGGNAVRPTLLFDVVKASIVIRELAIELIQRVLLRFVKNVVAALNITHEQIMSRCLLVVKG